MNVQDHAVQEIEDAESISKRLRQHKRENFGLEILVRKIRLFMTSFPTFARLDVFYMKVRFLMSP